MAADPTWPNYDLPAAGGMLLAGQPAFM